MQNPHLPGTRVSPKASYAIYAAHLHSSPCNSKLPSTLKCYLVTPCALGGVLHHAVIALKSMLRVSSRFYISELNFAHFLRLHSVELHSARLLAPPHLKTACCASHCTSTWQNCMRVAFQESPTHYVLRKLVIIFGSWCSVLRTRWGKSTYC